MGKIDEARQFLAAVGMPQAQQADICALTLLAMGAVRPENSWAEASNNWVRIHDILGFISEHYGRSYAENSRETFRKQALHHFRLAALVEDNAQATNSPNYRYRLTEETLSLCRLIGARGFERKRKFFLQNHIALADMYASKRTMTKIPIVVNNATLLFSPGKHNLLQKSIIEEFGPRFAPGAECLYLGDTVNKELVKVEAVLAQLGFVITAHDKMPDVVLLHRERNWLYFIEAVTSVGPISVKRVLEIEEMTQNVACGKIFVTAFPDFHTYKKFASELAWETEVWIAEHPDHMIHLNGDRFMGPYQG